MCNFWVKSLRNVPWTLLIQFPLAGTRQSLEQLLRPKGGSHVLRMAEHPTSLDPWVISWNRACLPALDCHMRNKILISAALF